MNKLASVRVTTVSGERDGRRSRERRVGRGLPVERAILENPGSPHGKKDKGSERFFSPCVAFYVGHPCF